jgi:hypothetical protein
MALDSPRRQRPKLKQQTPQQQASTRATVQGSGQGGTAAGASGAGGAGGAASKAASTAQATRTLPGITGISTYAGPGGGMPGATPPTIATPSIGGPGVPGLTSFNGPGAISPSIRSPLPPTFGGGGGVPGLSSYAGPSQGMPGPASPYTPGLPRPPAPPTYGPPAPPAQPGILNRNLTGPQMSGRLGQAARGAGGIGAFVGGQAITAQGDDMNNDFLRGAGGGMSLAPFAAMAPGVAMAPAVGVATLGAGIGNVGGRELTEWLPDQIAETEQLSNVDLARSATNPLMAPVAGMEALDRFGDYIGVDNFGNFKDKAREGQRTLSDVVDGIPFIGGMFGGGSGGEDPAVAQAAAQTAARQSLSDPAVMQQFLSDYGMSPEGGQAAMNYYQQSLSRNRALAERGMLSYVDENDEPVIVTPEQVEDFTLTDWTSGLDAMAAEDAQSQQLMSQAAAWQAQLAPQYDAAIAQQEVLNGAYQAALDANPYLPDNMRAAFQQYFDVAGAGQMQGLNDIRMQGIGLPAMQALQEQQAISDQVRQREIQQYIDGMFATESGGAGSGLNIDIFGDGS